MLDIPLRKEGPSAVEQFTAWGLVPLPERKAAAELLGARISAASSVNLFGQLPPSLSHFFQDLSVPFRLGFPSEPAALIRKLSTLSWRRCLYGHALPSLKSKARAPKERRRPLWCPRWFVNSGSPNQRSGCQTLRFYLPTGNRRQVW